MSEIKVNKISPKQTCTQLTLGDSGDTIIIPAGATITNNGTATGFGRTGTVDWDTTKKTTGFTAVSGVGYFCDTTSAAFTMTLPATPTAGDIVALKDYANTFDTNNLTVDRNGSNINGSAANAVISVQGQALTLIYIDATQGWSAIYGATDSDLPIPAYVAATGGTITTCGNYKIHSFTGPGTFTVTSAGNPAGSSTVDYLVVAGGGGGGSDQGGGGGAGGYRESKATGAPWTASPLASSASLPVTATAYPITVGGGGTRSILTVSGPGNPSIFSTITSTGGGGGGGYGNPNSGAPQPGGSGGGAGGSGTPGLSGASTGNTPPVSPPQGNPGGFPSLIGNSGGGAGGAGVNCGNSGGAGVTTSISGSPTGYAGGGGGRSTPAPAGIPFGAKGYGPGAPGSGPTYDGTTNTGSGGGGAGTGGPAPSNESGAGGSGIVVIRYKYQ
jgi:hypothetical protein